MTSNNNLTDELLTSETSNGDMSKANTFLPMQDLDTDHIKALIHHYLSVREKLPDNLTVRDRLEELQAELINRTSTIEGVIRQNTENPL
jgi:hypothetical protein